MGVVEVNVAAWRQTVAAVLELAGSFAEAEWAAATEGPGWTVRDVYAHLVGGELWMAAGHFLPAEGLAAIAGLPVAARRGLAGEAVLAELRAAVALRELQLTGNPPDGDVPTKTAFGMPVTVGTLLAHRAFDWWTHEQDVRRAVGRPGNLGSAAARLSSAILTESLPYVVAKRAGAAPGSVVRFAVTGEVPFERTVVIDGNGRGAFGDGEPTTTIVVGWEVYARLASGRIRAADADVRVEGDGTVAERILARFAITP
jgi:uncharacterized protein (TIGR03083 family)